jgi:hypothetical protein
MFTRLSWVEECYRDVHVRARLELLRWVWGFKGGVDHL